VGYVHDREILFITKSPQEIEDAETHRDVEHRNGFIGQKYVRAYAQSSGNGDPLELST
jgi:hypothetical protein